MHIILWCVNGILTFTIQSMLFVISGVIFVAMVSLIICAVYVNMENILLQLNQIPEIAKYGI